MGGMEMTYEHLKIDRIGSIATLSINRPEALNALNYKLLVELKSAVDSISADDSVHVLILTGEGRAFAAGADIAEMKDMGPDQARGLAKLGLEVFRAVELMEKPSIAAVNGFALGGGCELAMSCDIRIASSKAKFGQPEVNLGVTPGFGGTNRLARLVGPAKAKEMIFTGDVIDALEAEKLGLVNMVTEPESLMGKSMELAEKIASRGQLAVRYSKQAINRSFETDIETGMEIERNLFSLCFATEDQKEGMDAFLNKRKPEFKVK
jgi:enoyl-CoA hydratase